MLAKPYSKYGPQLQMRLKSRTLKLARCTTAWRVDHVLAKSSSRKVFQTEGQLKLTMDDGRVIPFTVSRDMLAVLLQDSKLVLQLIQSQKKQ